MIKNNKNSGYAILFALVVITIISVITLGLSSSTQKQMVISSVAKDSRTAFFEADTAVECALYADNFMRLYSETSFPDINPNFGESGNFSCGVDPNGNDYVFSIVLPEGGISYVGGYATYALRSLNNLNVSSDPCFDMDIIKKKDNATITDTKIKARGYSNCMMDNSRTVEREIDLTY